jgi:hypothetical protein
MPTDIIGRPLAVGDYVVFYNNIYEILAFSVNCKNARNIMHPASPTSKSQMTQMKSTCSLTLLPGPEVTLYFLKK